HYDISGNVDRWGSKLEILFLPIFMCMMYIFLTIIEKFQQIWNNGVEVTEENKERVYSNLLHLLSTMKFIIMSVFSYIIIQTTVVFKLSIWFLPIFMFILFTNLSYWIWRLYKEK